MNMVTNPKRAPIERRLGEYIARSCQMPLDSPVLNKAKQHILDTVASMISGSRLPAGEKGIRYATSLGGTAIATIIGSRLVTNVATAALTNGILAHADETDDSHAASLTHPGCAIVPAALAMAEQYDRSGEDLIRAVVLGYDICSRLTQALGVEHLCRTARSTHALGGLFGAAAAAAALSHVDAQQATHVLSYAAHQASGLYCWVRDREHIQKAYVFAGMPAQAGASAALMVKAGMTGIEDSLSGERGLFDALSPNCDVEAMVCDLGTRFDILSANLKKWSVGSPIQASLDALEILLQDRAVVSEKIKWITISLPDNHAWVVDNRDMPAVCVQHLAAVFLIDGFLSFESIHDVERMKDERVLGVRRRVQLIASTELTQARPERQAIVSIELDDGRKLEHRTYAVRGSVDDPMPNSEVQAKARDLMVPILSADQVENLIARFSSLELVANVRELRPLLQSI